MRFRRSMEVLVQPAALSEIPSWMGAESVRVRVGGHEVVLHSTKEGLEVTYETPKGKKPKAVSAEASLEGARLRIAL